MNLRLALNALCDSALALVYPQACDCCGSSVESRADGVACSACWAETHIISKNETLCDKCGASTQISAVRERQLWKCKVCDEEYFDAARACGLYEIALRASVLALKREPHIAPRLVDLLSEVQREPPLGNATRIVPVPLHPKRERERGFNQSAILARALARRSGLPCSENVVERTEHTQRHRAGMDARARRQSVEGAFKVRGPRLAMDERILLIDDVYTTGATVSSCAKALKSAGAKEVLVLTIARSGIDSGQR